MYHSEKQIIPYLSHRPEIADGVFIAPGAFVIGDVKIGADTNIWYHAVLRGDVNFIRIGERVNIQDMTVIHVTRGGAGTIVEDDVTIGHSAILHACTVRAGAYIGMQSCLLDGSEVEREGMLGAGSLLTGGKIVKSGQLWAGRPAKLIRDLTEADLMMMQKSAPHYVTLAKEHMRSLGGGSVITQPS